MNLPFGALSHKGGSGKYAAVYLQLVRTHAVSARMILLYSSSVQDVLVDDLFPRLHSAAGGELFALASPHTAISQKSYRAIFFLLLPSIQHQRPATVRPISQDGESLPRRIRSDCSTVCSVNKVPRMSRNAKEDRESPCRMFGQWS